MCKFKLLSEEHEDLKLKFESINDTNDSLEMKQTIPCAIPISRVDASTSCIDLIDESCSNPCKEKYNENVVVESCDDLIAKENDELKQEVERLMKDLYRLKGKDIESNVQPYQDNHEDMMKKLEKGATVSDPGLLIDIEYSRVRDSSWMYLTSFVTTRIGIELATVQRKLPDCVVVGLQLYSARTFHLTLSLRIYKGGQGPLPNNHQHLRQYKPYRT